MNALPTPPIDGLALEPVAGAVPAWRALSDPAGWLAAAAAIARRGGRLAGLWTSDGRDAGQAFAVHAAFATYEGLLCLELPVSESQPVYPDLSLLYPCAGRMQRAVFDLVGLAAQDADGVRPDARGWLRHGAWRENTHPLRREVDAQARLDPGDADYAFVPVEGEGVHEIAVGPVHAGTIEPGHFRFTANGEYLVRLEQRLGYVHKGIEALMAGATLDKAAKLAARTSGDSTVAYGWAYCMALESCAGASAPPRDSGAICVACTCRVLCSMMRPSPCATSVGAAQAGLGASARPGMPKHSSSPPPITRPRSPSRGTRRPATAA